MTSMLIGLGNPQRGDDAVGLAVARRVAALELPDVDVVEVDDPISLIDTWCDADPVVVVDAMSSRQPPGTVRAIDVTDQSLPDDGRSAGGSHALGLATAVELSRALGRLPARLVVVGVEVHGVSTGSELSAPVRAALDSAVSAARRGLEGGGA
ncbi:MAG: hydrogenase maturation protease [Actinomycetota bacterium]|nr:hydrogenase maturation protease [Actinomycetota bacterium]